MYHSTHPLMELIRKRIVFFDGGMGSLLQERGLEPGQLPETWNMTHQKDLIEIHKEYLKAGADVITTNTFGANSLKFNHNTEYSLPQIVAAAVDHARQARDAVERETGHHGFIALDLGPTGKLLKPLGDLAFSDACSLYGEVVRAGAEAGADLVAIETMSDGYEAKAAILAAKENSSLPVFVTTIFDEKGKLLTGGDVASTVALLEGLRVDVLGINCGLGPVQMKPVLEQILQVSSTPVLVNPNAGLPRSEGGKTVYDIDASAFASVMKEIVDMGASLVGGCCGTTPEHIRKTVELCQRLPQRLPKPKHRSVVSSYAQAVVIDKDPVIIGERINPTGKSKFKQALREHNLEYILREGVSQQDNGTHVLDVNVGLPEIDEPSMMEEVIQELQSVVDLPLQIDTSNLEAMERGMRIYNGKPLINSVNGKREVMEAVFPLVQRYGGTVVALALDEDGIPDTARGRVHVAKKIYETAASYGIGPEDIIIDGLCMTVSSDSQGALTTLETLRRVRDELNGKTILGVSNISFGLPQREIVNSTFFALALANGLNAAIINPNSEAMMRAYYSFRALAALDPQCGDYIQVYSKQTGSLGQTVSRSGAGAAQNVQKDLSLGESVEKGLRERAAAAAAEALTNQPPLEVINEIMIPALDRVGKGFEKGTLFLPQLLMSAEAAKAAFEVIKDSMNRSGQAQEKKARIVLATVRGDIHDIGKNIVKVLLENYSYEVLDLGKDVPPELVVETVVKEHAPLVGLSALMTTTVPSMEETIRQLRKNAPWAKVMVGGAVLTEEYAKTIGADQYCKDAMASVNYAESVCIQPQ